LFFPLNPGGQNEKEYTDRMRMGKLLRPSAAIAQPQLSLDGGSSICECVFGRAFTVGI
jgi:hypothetical protein